MSGDGGTLFRNFNLIIFYFLAFLAQLSAEINTRIINGTASSQGAWPWMVALIPTNANPETTHFCGGVLINQSYVLTAAHCVFDVVKTPQRLQVVAGRTTLSSNAGMILNVAGVFVHPEFNPHTSENDVALLRLGETANLPTIEPVQLGEEYLWLAGTQAVVLGWGMTDRNLPGQPDILQQAEIPIIPDTECRNQIGPSFKPQSMLCAGVLSSTPSSVDGVDSCFGDSGGPLVVRGSTGWKVVGLVSWGFECASHTYWGIYTKLPRFAEWILSSPPLPPINVKVPSVTGRPRVGAKIHCNEGEWAGDVSGFFYDWIDSATKRKLFSRPNFRIKRNNVGRKLQCRVRARNAGGQALARSRPYGPIAPRG